MYSNNTASLKRKEVSVQLCVQLRGLGKHLILLMKDSINTITKLSNKDNLAKQLLNSAWSLENPGIGVDVCVCILEKMIN